MNGSGQQKKNNGPVVLLEKILQVFVWRSLISQLLEQLKDTAGDVRRQRKQKPDKISEERKSDGGRPTIELCTARLASAHQPVGTGYKTDNTCELAI